MRAVLVSFPLLVLVGCRMSAEPEPTPRARVESAAAAATSTAATSATVTRLGAPVQAGAQAVDLADVARAPASYAGRTFTTTGTVTAVCQHMGCWMELRDAASEAHVKMAGHSFFVPKSASGRKARILGRLVKTDEPEAACAHGGAGGGGCRAEAEAQTGKPLPKLELVAEGVELYEPS